MKIDREWFNCLLRHPQPGNGAGLFYNPRAHTWEISTKGEWKDIRVRNTKNRAMPDWLTEKKIYFYSHTSTTELHRTV